MTAQPANPDRALAWRIHHVCFGVALRAIAKRLGVSAELKRPGADIRRVDVVLLLNHECVKS